MEQPWGGPWLPGLLQAATKPAVRCCGAAVYLTAAPVAFAFCTVAVAAGIGGGALYMPVYFLATKDAHVAVPLAKVTTNGVGCSGFLFNVWRQHPQRPGKPLVDYGAAFVMEPLTLLGTVAGVLLNIFLTSTEVLVTLVVLLSYTAYRTIAKGREQWRKETAELAAGCGAAAGEVELADRQERSPSAVSAFSAPDFRVPWWRPACLAALWLAHGGVLLASGGPLQMACGGSYEASLLLLDLALLGGFSLVTARRAANAGEADAAQGGLCFGALSFLCGVAAGALGIAGGLLQGPLLISRGLLPQAATATAIFLTVLTSGSTILQFALLGRLQLLPSLVFWTAGFAGGLLGSRVVAGFLQRRQRQSYISLLLGTLVLLSMLSMCVVDALQVLGWVPEEEGRNAREACGERGPALLRE